MYNKNFNLSHLNMYTILSEKKRKHTQKHTDTYVRQTNTKIKHKQKHTHTDT